MSAKHDELVEVAKKAISAVFSDRSVSPRDTMASLKDLAGDIDTMCDALENDIRNAEDES